MGQARPAGKGAGTEAVNFFGEQLDSLTEMGMPDVFVVPHTRSTIVRQPGRIFKAERLMLPESSGDLLVCSIRVGLVEQLPYDPETGEVTPVPATLFSPLSTLRRMNLDTFRAWLHVTIVLENPTDAPIMLEGARFIGQEVR